MTIEENKIVIRSTKPIDFKPYEIQQYHFNFTSSEKNLPELEINENLDILHSSQVTISKISLFNILDNNQVLQTDMKIMEFSYNDQDQILSIPTSQEQIYKDDNFLSSIIQSNFPQNIANVTERFARNLIFKEDNLCRVYYSTAQKKKKNKNDNIAELSSKEEVLTLSSAHLLKSLLNKSFGGSPKDLQEIQKHDLNLNKIMENVNKGSNTSFVLPQTMWRSKKYSLCNPASCRLRLFISSSG